MIYPLNTKKFYSLWLVCILGALCVLPYAAVLTSTAITLNLVLVVLAQAAVLYGFILFFGIRLSEKLDFKIIPDHPFVLLSIASGAAIGLLMVLLDRWLFQINLSLLLNYAKEISVWQAVLASFYGALNEEVLVRLFLVSFFAWAITRVLKLKKSTSIIFSILLCALLFGVGHLPMLYKILGTPSNLDILRILFLNGIGGIVFGLLYWRYGLLSAILSHFVADLVIQLSLKIW